jgi:hypothetical protein
MVAPCTDAEVRRALSTVAIKCADAALLERLVQAAQQHGLSAKALATRYSAFTINRCARARDPGGARPGGAARRGAARRGAAWGRAPGAAAARCPTTTTTPLPRALRPAARPQRGRGQGQQGHARAGGWLPGPAAARQQRWRAGDARARRRRRRVGDALVGRVSGGGSRARGRGGARHRPRGGGPATERAAGLQPSARRACSRACRQHGTGPAPRRSPTGRAPLPQSSRLADTVLPGVKADQKQPPSTPPQRGGRAAAGEGSPLTPASVPRSAFKERANVSGAGGGRGPGRRRRACQWCKAARAT